MTIGHPKQVRRLWGTLKDKISVAKATAAALSRHRPTTTLRLAVLKATTHDPTTSPPPAFLSDLVLLCHHSSAAAPALDALLSRLRHTSDPFVALKCLLSLHHLLPFLPRHTGNNPHLLHLSDNFRDQSDPDRWQVCLWARWFAELISAEMNLTSNINKEIVPGPVPPVLSDQALVERMGALVSIVEQMGTAPESLECQTIGLVYEAMKLAGEDYRMTMRELYARIREMEDRVEGFEDELLKEVIDVMERMEGCKEKMLRMFLNKKRNDGVWDAVAEVRGRGEAELRRREGLKVVVVVAERAVVEPTRRRRWLDVDWNKALTVATTS